MAALQVYLTGMVPLAIGAEHVELNRYYVKQEHQLRRFADMLAWREAIFAHLEKSPELLMRRLWQCVEANDADRIPPSLEDLVDPPPTPIWQTLAILTAWATVLLTASLLVIRCLRLHVCQIK